MKLAEPELSTQATAHALLLDPGGLGESELARAMGEIYTHDVDYADLYFQYARTESWGLEEGIVKAGNFSIQQGVGVRALSGEKTAFAYSDELTPDAIMASAQAVKTIASQGGGQYAMPRPAHPSQ